MNKPVIPVDDSTLAGGQSAPDPDVLNQINRIEAKIRDENATDPDSTWNAQSVSQNPSRSAKEHPNNPKPGDQIDRYKLIEKIGEGGMGTVWKAKQTEPVDRMVAIKLVHQQKANAKNLDLFKEERQTLARMNHPNVSSILDGGTTPAGAPFLVMELAKGCRLDDFCQQNRLSVTERIQLVARICSAVSHAHEQGIIHRDLKPANILAEFNESGIHFKIIDFGISAVLSSASEPSQLNEIVGTPHFMSPEQTSGGKNSIDARSDVYALCAILFQLITDVPPLVAQGHDLVADCAQLFQTIQNAEPIRPSRYLRKQTCLDKLAEARSTTKKYLLKQTGGDLDLILTKSLARSPDDRYASTKELANDLENFINFRPILAKKQTTFYRVSKWVRRKRVLVALSLALLICTTLSVAGFVQLERKKQWEVKQKTELAEHRISAAIDAARSNLQVARDNEQSFEHHIPKARLEIQKARQWLAEIVEAYPAKGLRDELDSVAADLQSAERAKILVEALDNAISTTLQYDPKRRSYSRAKGQTEILSALSEFGLIGHFNSFSADARRCKALAEFQRHRLVEAIHFFLSELDLPRSNNTPYPRSWMFSLANELNPDPWRCKVRNAIVQGDLSALEKLGVDETKLDQQRPYLSLLLADSIAQLGNRKLAVRLLIRAQSRSPENVWLTQYLGKAFLYEKEQIDYAAAARFLTAAISLDPNNSMMHFGLGEALVNLHQYEAAIASLRQAIKISPRFLEAKQMLANALQYAGENEKSVEVCRQILEASPNEVETMASLAAAYLRLGKANESIQHFKRAIHHAPKNATLHLNLAQALSYLGKHDRAIHQLRTALQKFPRNVRLQFALGSAHLSSGNIKQAIEWLEKSAEKEPMRAEYCYALAVAYHHDQQFEKADKFYRTTLQIQPNHADAKKAIESLAGWMKNKLD